MRESRKFTLIALIALILVVLLAVASGKAEAQPLGNALTRCWGSVQSASVFNWKTFETTPLTSDQIAQVLAWDDSVKFWTKAGGFQYPSDLILTENVQVGTQMKVEQVLKEADYTINFKAGDQTYSMDVRISTNGHAYILPLRTSAPVNPRTDSSGVTLTDWHGCDDLVIPASDFLSLLPAHPERHDTPQVGDVFQCKEVMNEYPLIVNQCWYGAKP